MKKISLLENARTDNLVAMLSCLAAACEKDARRFDRACREVHNEELTLLFCRYARRRAEFAKELKAHIERLEGRDDSIKSENAGLRSHRRVSLKPLPERRDDGTILSDLEHAERSLSALYEEALKADLPGDLPMSLRRQHLAVSDVFAQLRDLCDALAWCAVPMAV